MAKSRRYATSDAASTTVRLRISLRFLPDGRCSFIAQTNRNSGPRPPPFVSVEKQSIRSIVSSHRVTEGRRVTPRFSVGPACRACRAGLRGWPRPVCTLTNVFGRHFRTCCTPGSPCGESTFRQIRQKGPTITMNRDYTPCPGRGFLVWKRSFNKSQSIVRRPPVAAC